MRFFLLSFLVIFLFFGCINSNADTLLIPFGFDSSFLDLNDTPSSFPDENSWIIYNKDINGLVFSVNPNLPDTNNANFLNGLDSSDFIRTDGSSVTTSNIPFAEGIRVPDEKILRIGSAFYHSIYYSPEDRTMYIGDGIFDGEHPGEISIVGDAGNSIAVLRGHVSLIGGAMSNANTKAGDANVVGGENTGNASGEGGNFNGGGGLGSNKLGYSGNSCLWGGAGRTIDLETSTGTYAGIVKIGHDEKTISSHSLNAENDLLVGGELEVDGQAFFDSNVFSDGNVTAREFCFIDGSCQTDVGISESDGNDLFVNLDGEETVVGTKTFDANIIFSEASNILMLAKELFVSGSRLEWVDAFSNRLAEIYFDNGLINPILYLKAENISLVADNGNGKIKLDGTVSFGDNKKVGFGNGDVVTGGNPDAQIYYQSSNNTWQFEGHEIGIFETPLSSIVWNKNLYDTDFQINGTINPNLFFLDAGNNRIGIGTENPATELDVNGGIKTIDLNVTNNSFFGNDQNYTSIDGNGIITLHGNAKVNRHIRVTAPSWKGGVTAPAPNFVGIMPTLAFDKTTDDSSHYSLLCPFRMEAGSTINIIIDWTYTGAQDNGTVNWTVEYINLATGEAIASGTTTITVTSAGNHTTGTLIRTELNTGITGAVSHDVIGLRLYRDASEDTLNTDAELVQTHFEFVMDKLGEAS